MGESTVDNEPSTYKVTLWDKVQEMEISQKVRMESSE